ncbi:MAG: membrane-associated protein [Coxiella burnetii]|nr:membrane-associated protein [Coxiella burnetii]
MAYEIENHIFLGLLNQNQKIDAFICLRIMNNLATAAPGGYNSNLSQNLNLYRQQNALTIEYIKAKNYLLNLGPGVDRFKLNRGGIPVFQYSAVYFHHLSFARKIPWFLLQRALKFMTIERYLKVVSK